MTLPAAEELSAIHQTPTRFELWGRTAHWDSQPPNAHMPPLRTPLRLDDLVDWTGIFSLAFYAFSLTMGFITIARDRC